MDDTRLQAAEEQIAHLIRAQDELSQVVADQTRAIAALERRLLQVQARISEAEDIAPGTAADMRPPHW